MQVCKGVINTHYAHRCAIGSGVRLTVPVLLKENLMPSLILLPPVESAVCGFTYMPLHSSGEVPPAGTHPPQKNIRRRTPARTLSIGLFHALLRFTQSPVSLKKKRRAPPKTHTDETVDKCDSRFLLLPYFSLSFPLLEMMMVVLYCTRSCGCRQNVPLREPYEFG